ASEGDSTFGATKLNKILFFCDFLAYRRYGQSITGQRYFKLPQGPAPRALVPVVKELIAEGSCIQVQRQHFGYRQETIFASRDANLDEFSAAEIALTDFVLRELRGNSASEVSDLSHQFIGWQLAGDREDIPFEAVFLGDPRKLVLTGEEIRYGEQLAARDLDREV
ncbi:MAG: SocA family protein, partial [Acidobacteria bacterium]|nr:SocA family protein [Acidobacteriota bacterium]